MASERIMEAAGEHVNLEEVRKRMATYAHQIRELLEGSNAAVETYKFAVEKEGDGFAVDIAVRASVHPKRAGISK